MPVEDLNIMATAILVARETGGSLPDVLERLAFTMKEKKRVLDKLVTLTTQARWQAIVISLLPVFFAAFQYYQSPEFLKVMTTTHMGKMALATAVVFELLGIILITKTSKIGDI